MISWTSRVISWHVYTSTSKREKVEYLGCARELECEGGWGGGGGGVGDEGCDAPPPLTHTGSVFVFVNRAFLEGVAAGSAGCTPRHVGPHTSSLAHDHDPLVCRWRNGA